MHASCPYCRKEMHEKEIFVPPLPEVEVETIIREPEHVSFNLSEMNDFLNKYFSPGGWYVPEEQWNAMWMSGLYKTDSTYQGEQRILFNHTDLDFFLLHKCWDTLHEDQWNNLPKDGETMSGAFESARYDFSSPIYLPYTSTTFTAHTWEIPPPIPFDAEAEFEPFPAMTWHLVDGGFVTCFLLDDEESLASFQSDAMTVRQAEEFASTKAKKIQTLWRRYRQEKRFDHAEILYKQSLDLVK
jgi:hypothetical protein